jgi:hypothetical protein
VSHFDRKIAFGPPGISPESEAASERFHDRSVTKVVSEVKQRLFVRRRIPKQKEASRTEGMKD